MFKLYASNLVDQSIITASSENILFPKSNLTHPFRTKVFRSTDNSSSLIFDFSETSEVDSVVIVDVPRDGFGVSTLTIQFSGTSDFTSPAFSQALTINTVHGIATAYFATQSYRFARIVMTSTLGYCELSKVFIGKAIEFENGMGVDIGWSFRDDELSKSKENSYGQMFVDVKTRRRFFSFNINSMNKDELDQVLELYDDKGETKPFYFTLGTTDMVNDPARFSGMYYLASVPSITNKSFGLYDISLSLKEAM